MSSDEDIGRFIRDYSKEIAERNAALFIGAGLSVGAGYVDWKKLLLPVAEELGIAIDKEHDLVSLAQYYVNEAGGNRGKINALLIEEFTAKATLTQNHKLLARLPIPVYWTTNYDKLIEEALEGEGKRPDVKHAVNQLQLTKPGRDAIVYKMHGDVDHPADAVLIKDDYERYHQNRQPFLTALSGDLVSMSFLFIGLSFSDPNLDYIFSRVRIWLGKNVRQHYAILRRSPKRAGRRPKTTDYEERRQELFINDLKRFGIKVLLINEYGDITRILSRLYELHRGKSVLISGAASEYGRWGRDGADALVSRIARELIKSGYRIVSGFGLGIGSAVVSGALEQIYSTPQAAVGERMVLRPFPQITGPMRADLYPTYREDLISLAGIVIFLFGNRTNGRTVEDAAGVLQEFDIAVKKGLTVIPIGATGYVARKLWDKVMADFDRYFPKVRGIKQLFASLGRTDASEKAIVGALVTILERIRGTR
jgi:hypothetical protein